MKLENVQQSTKLRQYRIVQKLREKHYPPPEYMLNKFISAKTDISRTFVAFFTFWSCNVSAS